MRERWRNSLRDLRQQTRARAREERESGGNGDVVEFARERLGFEADAKQALVLRGGRRGIVNCTRQWGKSTVTAVKAVHRAHSAAGSLTLVLSPSGRQSGEFLRKAEEFVRRLGIRVRGDGDNELSIAFPNGSRIVGLPGNETTVRGFSAVSLMLIDEAARVEDELYRAMRPVLAVGDGDLWLMSTPNGKQGFFWEEWDHGAEEWERISVAAPECGRISERFLAEERAKGDKWYRQEYLCCFVDMDGAVFPRELIDGAFEDFEGLRV
jgi:Terminase large subunit, T4likevirus-type, N-terminal